MSFSQVPDHNQIQNGRFCLYMTPVPFTIPFVLPAVNRYPQNIHPHTNRSFHHSPFETLPTTSTTSSTVPPFEYSDTYEEPASSFPLVQDRHYTPSTEQGVDNRVVLSDNWPRELVHRSPSPNRITQLHHQITNEHPTIPNTLDYRLSHMPPSINPLYHLDSASSQEESYNSPSAPSSSTSPFDGYARPIHSNHHPVNLGLNNLGQPSSNDSASLRMKYQSHFPHNNQLCEVAIEISQSSWLRNHEREPPLQRGHMAVIWGIVCQGNSRFDCFYDRGKKKQCLWVENGKQCAHTADRPGRAREHAYKHFDYRPVPCQGKCTLLTCVRRFVSPSHLTDHIKRAKQPKQRCDNCKDEFTVQNFNRHRTKCIGKGVQS